MRAPEVILRVWQRFADLPMETLTKAWWYQQCKGSPQQRSVDLMQLHRTRFGCGGNCFDLAIWLLEDFGRAGLQAYAVGHDLCTPDAHIAVIVLDRYGNRYLCDLGDQWLEPILIDREHPDFHDGFHLGFFPGAQVSLQANDGEHLLVRYRRANGKVSHQRFTTTPIGPELLMQAANHSQSLLRHPLVEVRARHPRTETTGHWEYSHGRSYWSLETGMMLEDDCATQADWADRIHVMTGISQEIISTAFDIYSRLGTELD